MTFGIHPVAFVRSPRVAAVDDDWDTIASVIELAADVPPESLTGLDRHALQ